MVEQTVYYNVYPLYTTHNRSTRTVYYYYCRSRIPIYIIYVKRAVIYLKPFKINRIVSIVAVRSVNRMTKRWTYTATTIYGHKCSREINTLNWILSSFIIKMNGQYFIDVLQIELIGQTWDDKFNTLRVKC
jgi:hypothetical protein